MNPPSGDQEQPGLLTPQELSTAYGRALVQKHLGRFDLVFSAGPYCRSAFHLRRFFNQTQAFPFDWWVTPATSALRMLQPDYRFGLQSSDVHLTHAAQAVLNSRDLILHLHDFKRTASGDISIAKLDDQLAIINSKYNFLFDRLRERMLHAKHCLVIFEGFMPALSLETYRQRTACPPLSYPSLPTALAPELAELLRETYGVNPIIVSFGLGAPAIERQPDLLRITVPMLSSSCDDSCEPWQRPWSSYDMLISLLCASVSF